MFHILLILLSLGGYLGCFLILVVRNNAAMNMAKKYLFWDPAFNPFSGIVLSCDKFIFNFLRNRILFSVAFYYTQAALESGKGNSSL